MIQSNKESSFFSMVIILGGSINEEDATSNLLILKCQRKLQAVFTNI